MNDAVATTTPGPTVDELLVDRRAIPYEFEVEPGAIGHRARIGIVVLASDLTIEHEFRQMLDIEGVAFYESRIYNDSTINAQTLAAMEARIADATRLIVPDLALDVVAYACTSGTLVIGERNVHARIREARPGIACTTPMEAAVAGLQALGARSLCLIAPYADTINRDMRAYLIDHGFVVPVMASWSETQDANVARISRSSIAAVVEEFGRHPAVDAVFVSCTSMRLAADIEDLEARVGKPVVSSNQATAWHCLRLAGYQEPTAGFGRLFRTRLE